ncbi:hypothetical protein PHMEG_00028649 [Phytophthora megakarya]|uniref:Uncharacterized protein n=1 Tax=Phytophthora megakarya TaxID=4795 RepID=A0A225V4F9_9STRA|nr:hypothetical protein PHMEG_00028649 [Phytophthora megakarya]
MESSSALDKDTLIIERLGDDPEISDRFLSIRQGTKSLQSKTDDTLEMKAAAVATSRKKNDLTSKYVFVPRPDQEYVYDEVKSTKHKAWFGPKRFKAVPGVFIRAYDIRFGSVADAHTIDKIDWDSLSRIICHNNWNLEKTTRGLRGEGISDCRPNKTLDSGRLRMGLH